MTAIAIIAVAVASGVSAAVAAGLVVLVWQPWVGLFGLLRPLVRSANAVEATEVEVLVSIASDLRAGQSLRQALAPPAARTKGHPLHEVGRLAMAGAPMSSLEPSLGAALPASAALLVPALTMLQLSGGSAAVVFEQLAASRSMQVSLEREFRAALAPARASAAIMAVLVAGAILWLVVTGRATAVFALDVGRILGLIGVAFFGVGAAIFVLMVRRIRAW